MFPEIFDIDDNDGLIRAENSRAEKYYDVLEIDENQLEEFEELVRRCPTQVFRINK
jgi:ferredoxin